MKHFTSMVAIFALLALWGCGQSNTQALRIGTNLWLGYEPLYLASQREDWPGKDIHLIEYPSASEVLRAFRNHAIDAASLTLDEAILLKHDGIPIKIILVHDFSNGADVIMARPPIANVTELRNKVIAVENGALGYFFLSRALKKNNLGFNDIVVKNYDANLHTLAYTNAQVDAVVTFEPVRSELFNMGANEVFSSKSIPGEIVDVLVVHNDYAQNNPEKLERIIDDWFSTLAYMSENQQEAYAFISGRTKMSITDIEQSYHLIHIPSREENISILSKSGIIFETIKLLNQALIEINRISNAINTQSLITIKYL